MNRKQEREAWTAFVTGETTAYNKFGVAPKEERGGYASRHEMDVATNLHALATAGKIHDLREQVRIEVIPADPPNPAAFYIADFTYSDPTGYHVLDAKGVKTEVYILKKKALWHLKRIRIEEV